MELNKEILMKLYTEKILNPSKNYRQRSQAFQNGNLIVELPEDIFAVVQNENIISLFSVYEPHQVIYNERLDFILVEGHETIHIVYPDGTYDVNYTR